MRFRTAACALTIAAIFLVSALPAAAAGNAGALDTSFGSGGFSTVSVGTKSGAAADVVQPDGSIVTAGQAWLPSGETVMLITRMTPSGHLDPSFGFGGIVTVAINGGAGIDSGAALALQPDGKIVVAGTGRDGKYGPLQFAAVRLNTDGSLDQSFGSGGVAVAPVGTTYAIANAVAIQSNGDIVLGGGAQQGQDVYFAAARMTPNGSLDPSFGSGGTAFLTSQPTGDAWGMVLRADGGIVLAGQQTSCQSCADGYMAARLTPNGQLDPSFGNGGVFTLVPGANAAGLAVGPETNGDTVISGQAQVNGVWNVVTVALTPSGTLDPAFGSGGVAEFPGAGINALVTDTQGQIYLAGVGATIVRLTSNGALDGSFAAGGLGFYCDSKDCAANGIAFQPSTGGVVLAGATEGNGQLEVMVTRASVSGALPISTPSTTPPAGSASTRTSVQVAVAFTRARRHSRRQRCTARHGKRPKACRAKRR